MTAADFDTITIPRPKPDDVAIAITDADGASAWTTCPKRMIGEGGFLLQLLRFLAEGQQRVHERQADGQAGE